MSFLQSALLYGLPLALLPVLIHLINQYRHRSVQWGAMQFLLKAKRMNKGFARIRQILILAMRVLAVAALIFAVSRPLASGWVGLAAGGAADTTIILLDRSATMAQMDARTAESKRATALRKVSEMLDNLGDRSQVVLVESAHSTEVHELASAGSLLEQAHTSQTATAADLPAMLSTALDYLTTNEAGSADIWICSDRRASDWDREGGRWEGLRAGFDGLEAPARFYLLNYPETAEENLAVTVSNVSRRVVGDRAELVMDVGIRGGQPDAEVALPLGIVVNGTRTVSDLTLSGGAFSLQGHTIPIDSSLARGWGRVELPRDVNPIDDAWWFVFAEPEAIQTAIVSDEAPFVNPVETATRTGNEDSQRFEAKVLPSTRIAEIDWEATAMIVWQTALPTADSVAAAQLKKFIDEGKTVLFFAPTEDSEAEFLGHRWGEWQTPPEGEAERIATWRQDAGLLADTRSGEPLPVGEIRVFRHRALIGDTGSPLAKLNGGAPLLTRANSDRGKVYFCGALPQASDSSLARDGVVFYVMLQRALAEGAGALAGARSIAAGDGALGENPLDWTALADVPDEDRLHRELHAGAFQNADGHLRALNRDPSEDELRVIDETTVAELFEGLDYLAIDDVEGGESALVSEVWRAFLIAMALALILEALLCLPEKRRKEAEA